MEQQLPENLIPATDVIKRSGVDYHTLRYYTKIGLLPHMVRKLPYPGAPSTVGHYPESVLETLQNIKDLKAQGFKNGQLKAVISKIQDQNNGSPSVANLEEQVRLVLSKLDEIKAQQTAVNRGEPPPDSPTYQTTKPPPSTFPRLGSPCSSFASLCRRWGFCFL